MSDMNMYYITHTRMPTDKAHGITIMRSCESFAAAGAHVVFVTPHLKTKAQGDVFEIYRVPRTFSVRHVPTLDLVRYSGGRVAFLLRLFTFYASATLYMLFRQRAGTVIYTRDAPLIALRYLGFRVVYECHHLFSRNAGFFALARRAHRIVTISEALKRSFVAAGVPAHIVLAAPSGVDLAIFGIEMPQESARASLDLPMKGHIALYTGNFTTMDQSKGIEQCIAAMRETGSVYFVAAGGDAADIKKYEQLAHDLGVANRVILRGHMPQTELAKYQRAADVLVMPFPDTPHYRNHMSPVKMFEYMASGRPIVSTDLPTIREVLNDENAIIVRPGDPEALARGISSIFSDPARGQRLAVRARIDVERYTWRARARGILQFVA